MESGPEQLAVRRHNRRECDLSGWVRVGDQHAAQVVFSRAVSESGEAIPARIVDCSEGGLGIHTSVYLPRGVTLVVGFQLGDADPAGRPQLTADIDRMTLEIRVGRRLRDGLVGAKYIPSFARRMLSAGEQSGELVRMTTAVAKHYERETEHRVKTLTTVLEPVLVVTIAGVVLVIALSIFLPMWNMVQLMS